MPSTAVKHGAVLLRSNGSAFKLRWQPTEVQRPEGLTAPGPAQPSVAGLLRRRSDCSNNLLERGGHLTSRLFSSMSDGKTPGPRVVRIHLQPVDVVPEGFREEKAPLSPVRP